MRPVLLCYDGSSHADLALRCAGTLLRPKPAVVLLIPPVTAGQAERGRQLARNAGFGPVATVEVGCRRVAKAVLDQAAGRDASVIVAGSYGDTPPRPGLPGALVEHGATPVLVGPRTAPPPSASEPIVLGYDGSRAARGALAAAGELLAGRAAIVAAFMPAVDQVAVLRSSLPWPAAADVRDELARLDRREAEAPAERAHEGTQVAAAAGFAAQPLGVAGIDASSEEEEEPWRRLLRAATDEGAACLVVGHAPASRAFSGTAHGLVHHADRPVLVVPAAP
jgi:nucleotide-binding universal stress UspA family protein